MDQQLKALEAGWVEVTKGAIAPRELGSERSLKLVERLQAAYHPAICMLVRAVAQCYANAGSRGELEPGDEVFPGAYRSVATARAETAAWAALSKVMETQPVTPVTGAPGDPADPCAAALKAACGAAHAYFLAHKNPGDRTRLLLESSARLADLAYGLEGAPSDVAEDYLAAVGPWACF